MVKTNDFEDAAKRAVIECLQDIPFLTVKECDPGAW